LTSFQINTELALQDSVAGILNGRLSAIDDIIRNRKDPHSAIHETRRTLKRIRALLRLVRDEIGYSSYYRENLCYREVAGRMARLRDTYVLRQMVRDVAETHPEVLSLRDLERLDTQLTGQIEQELEQFSGDEGGFEGVIEEMDKARERIKWYCELRNSFTSVRKGLRRVYSRGRRFLGRMEEHFSIDEFHEYRKNTKYLYYQMELIQPVFPKVIKAYAGTIDKHAEHLGEVRDLDRLENHIQELPGRMISSASKRKLQAVIEGKRESLMDKILTKSRLIYAERPKEFLERINSYWIHQYQNK
jgi:CHAD domain-containing protein